MPDETTGLSRQELNARSKIGRHIVYWALGAVTILGVAAMITVAKAKAPESFSQVKDILALLLPVIGAWVGTVLAFYFSRENYQTATENNAAMLNLTMEERLKRISAEDAMISMPDADALRSDAAEETLVLKNDILDSGPLSSGRNRLPILHVDGRARYIVHRSMVDKFIAQQALAENPVDINALTLKDFLDNDDFKALVTSFGAVRPEDSLSAVKQKMDSDPKCQDVIVTSDGSIGKPALGWITNVIVLAKSRA
jgi:hypothetical protein